MLWLLTPTGGRPDGLAMLAKYLDAQTYQGPAFWLIVDDCDPATPLPASRFPTQVIRPGWRWKSGMNTQAQSMLAGLDMVPDDASLLVIEDDDAYLPDYVQTMVDALASAELVGENGARYYNVRTRRYKFMATPRHSSLASTAVRGRALNHLRQACQLRPKFIDMRLWRDFRGTKTLLDAANVVGIKGLPGRAGIGVGHRPTFGAADRDNVLARWLGTERAKTYDRFAEATDREGARRTA